MKKLRRAQREVLALCGGQTAFQLQKLSFDAGYYDATEPIDLYSRHAHHFGLVMRYSIYNKVFYNRLETICFGGKSASEKLIFRLFRSFKTFFQQKIALLGSLQC